MADLKVTLSSFKKDVLVFVPDSCDLKESFNEAAAYVRDLEANNKIRDREAGVNPRGATHEIVKEATGDYRLRRFRFS